MQAWDRYAYTNNNPVRYTDPTGHDADCGIGERCSVSTVNGIRVAIKRTYKINMKKTSNFSLKDMRTTYNALGEMESGLNKITNNSGLGWIQKNFGGSSIATQASWQKMIFHESAHVEGNTIYLPVGFSDMTWRGIDGTARSMIIHEFGHVVDNRSKSSGGNATIFGGGAGDQLMNFIGGKSTGLLGFRWAGGVKVDPSFQYLGTGPGYAQNSSADYFAHTFTATILNHPSIPNMSIQFWMAALIDLTK